MSSKVCLTTFVYGRKYQIYLPLLIYSIKKAYPEYYVKIFVHGNLNKNIKKQLEILEILGGFEVKDNQFKELNISNGLASKLVRWVLPIDEFIDFKYLYIIDVDIFYLREPIPLHLQHIEHMKYLNLPFSNIYRDYRLETRKIKSIYHRLKDSGLTNFYKFINNRELIGEKMTGLHFIELKPYFEATIKNQKKLKNEIADGSYRKYIMNNNEILLYQMIKNTDFDLSGLGKQTNSTNMLDFNNPYRAEFRPHHGLHLGIFRASIYNVSTENILKSKEYLYYIDNFKKLLEDKLLISLLEISGKKIKKILRRMFSYYNIDKSNHF